MIRRNVLITGITGNLGKACLRRFGDDEVTGFSRKRFVYKKAGEPETFINDDVTSQYQNYVLNDDPINLVIMAHGVQKLVYLNSLLAMTIENYEMVMEENLTSAVKITNDLFYYERLAPNALIVYCSSIQASHPRRGRFAYAIAKAGLETLAKCVHAETGGKVRAVTLRLGQMEALMGGVEFTPEERVAMEEKTEPIPWVSFRETAAFIDALYYMNSVTGVTIPIMSGHGLTPIWPKG